MTSPQETGPVVKRPISTGWLMAMLVVAAVMPLIFSAAALPAAILLALIAALLAADRHDRIGWWIVSALIVAVWGYGLIRWAFF